MGWANLSPNAAFIIRRAEIHAQATMPIPTKNARVAQRRFQKEEWKMSFMKWVEGPIREFPLVLGDPPDALKRGYISGGCRDRGVAMCGV